MRHQHSSRLRANTRSASSVSEQSRRLRSRSRGRSQEQYIGPPGVMMAPPSGRIVEPPPPQELINGVPAGAYGPPVWQPEGPEFYPMYSAMPGPNGVPAGAYGPPVQPPKGPEFYPINSAMPGPNGIPLDPLGRPIVPMGYGPSGPVYIGPDGAVMNSQQRVEPRDKRRKKKHEKRDGSPHRHRSKSRGRQGDPLEQWTEWRRQMNESISADLTENQYRRIEVGEDFNNLARPSTKNHGRGVYNYSSTIDQATALHKDDYITFGIPRIQLGRERRPRNRDRTPPRRRQSSSSSQSDREETVRRSNETPYYTITKIKDHQAIQRVQQHMSPRYYASNADPDIRNGFPGMERMHADHPSSKPSRAYRNGHH